MPGEPSLAVPPSVLTLRVNRNIKPLLGDQETGNNQNTVSCPGPGRWAACHHPSPAPWGFPGSPSAPAAHCGGPQPKPPCALTPGNRPAVMSSRGWAWRPLSTQLLPHQPQGLAVGMGAPGTQCCFLSSDQSGSVQGAPPSSAPRGQGQLGRPGVHGSGERAWSRLHPRTP